MSNLNSFPTALIFDLDGTLMHSALDFNAMRQQVGCPHDQDILTYVAGLPAAAQKNASKIIIQHELRDAQQSHWVDGALEVISQLKQQGTPIALLTRNCEQAARVKLNRHFSWFEPLLTRDDAPPKPDPSGLIQIADQWQIPVQQITYVGDFVYDVQAANRAGMQSALFAPLTLPPFASQADLVFQRFDQLIARLSSGRLAIS